ncbi:probable cytochrome P450 6a14 [Anopheles ziemanni]|uniref:probable cytochrome P450 6a14 n=1 Tax=Anopheles coustani TaxID=139045 RepID=UPI00265A1F96|nr:probable cytochrome P450 6a14 [Anopheles coustani]XP_058166251.1 probable cytochrome P450 6a14 [Anopheles ziemanni]
MWIHLVVLAALAAVYWIRQRLSYWKHRGVAFVEPSFPQGNLGGLGKTRHMSQILQGCYEQLKSRGPFGGVFFFINPVALVTDLDLVKAVLVKDFATFHDRSLYHNPRDDPLSQHLVAMEGSKWKNLRAKLTPTFTSGKMKMMFSTVTSVAEEFTKCLTGEIASSSGVEMKDLLARFTTDVIGTVAFGLECNSLKDANARFRVMGRKVFEPSRYRAMKTFLAAQFPQLARTLHVALTPADIADFFMGVVKDTIQFRETNDVQRNDFMTLLMKVMKEDVLSGKGSGSGDQLTMDDIAAQAFVFFLAGFETSSTTMSFCLYELALHQELQDKARANIEEVLKKYDSISYEAVHDMKYIEMCINESLRKYPPATTLTRKANHNYRVAGTDHTLQQGLMVAVPVYAIHHDPVHFPDPERFDPERFSPEQTAKRHPFAFLPFGEGPRICIGLRFGMMQARIGLVYLLKHFRFTLDQQKMSVPLKVSASSPILTIEGGLWLKVQKL